MSEIFVSFSLVSLTCEWTVICVMKALLAFSCDKYGGGHCEVMIIADKPGLCVPLDQR